MKLLPSIYKDAPEITNLTQLLVVSTVVQRSHRFSGIDHSRRLLRMERSLQRHGQFSQKGQTGG